MQRQRHNTTRARQIQTKIKINILGNAKETTQMKRTQRNIQIKIKPKEHTDTTEDTEKHKYKENDKKHRQDKEVTINK